LNHTGPQKFTRRALVGVCALLFGVTMGACGEAEPDSGSGNPASADVDYEAALAGAPKPLKKLYAKGDALIPGGIEELESQLAGVRGYPAVVNVWASWCGPCRSEFPDFQQVAAKRGDEIAFLGLDAEDSDAAAQTFLEELPLPYPSVTDPDADAKREFGLVGYPATIYFNADGERTYVKQGPYRSAEEIEGDIARYAS
jgi:cytochrome c biogenesis protein CcmG/thiol:disulfide interchange protein DsbE